MGIGIAALTRNPGLTLWQLLGFTMGITMLLLLALVRVDLLEVWQESLPPDAPNHFLINIQPEEQEGLQRWFEANEIINSGMYATVRGRLTHIDGQKVDPDQYREKRARHLAGREFSLGFSDIMQSDNQVVAGESWQPAEFEQGGFSVEVKLADTLGIKPESRLTFDVAGQTLGAKVVNLRTVSWDSFNVNFFVQGSAMLMKDLPVAYINSVHLDDNNTALVVRKLAEEYPSVSLLDLQPMLQRIEEIMDRGAMAVESVFVFTLLAAILITVSAVQISREERAREIAILRTLGASQRQVLSSMLTEFGLLGLMSGFLGALLATIAGRIFAEQLFDLQAGINLILWLVGFAGGIVGLVLVGYFATRALLNTSPIHILRSR